MVARIFPPHQQPLSGEAEQSACPNRAAAVEVGVPVYV